MQKLTHTLTLMVKTFYISQKHCEQNLTPIHSFSSQCIDEEGFRLFLKTYLEVEDFPVDLCQRLFRSFQNSEPTQEDSASEILHHHVLTQLTASKLLCRMPLSIFAMACLAYIHLSLHACVRCCLCRYGNQSVLSVL